MKIKVTIFTILLLSVVFAKAQTIKWLVKPQFASITHYSTDIFRCTEQNGKLQLLDWDGKPLLPETIVADEVTEYSDGFAIVLKDNRILGFLSEVNHNFQPVSGEYYATKYSFFSEGYVAVAKGSTGGKQGYLDSKGNLILECKYLEAMPVHKGWALVVEEGKDKVKPRRYKRTDDWSGKGMSMLKSGESLVWATSFNTNGQALTKIKGGKYVVIDSNFNEIERKEKGNKEFVNTYDYSYKPEGSKEVNSPTNAKPVKDNDYSIYDKGGRKGYRTSDEEFVPAQFSASEDFYAGRAIVSMGNGYGIIELLNGKFEPNWSAERIRVYEYNNTIEPLQFTLTAPASFESNKVKLELDKGDGCYDVCNDLSCDFKVADQVINRKSPNCTLHAKATYSENGFLNLLLWEGTQPIEIDYISISLSSPAVTSVYADENDNQTVKAIVTNTSNVPVKVSATLNVAGKTAPFNGELKPKQSKTLTVTVKVDKDKNVNATITAKVDGHNCGSKSSTVSLKKI